MTKGLYAKYEAQAEKYNAEQCLTLIDILSARYAEINSKAANDMMRVGEVADHYINQMLLEEYKAL